MSSIAFFYKIAKKISIPVEEEVKPSDGGVKAKKTKVIMGDKEKGITHEKVKLTPEGHEIHKEVHKKEVDDGSEASVSSSSTSFTREVVR